MTLKKPYIDNPSYTIPDSFASSNPKVVFTSSESTAGYGAVGVLTKKPKAFHWNYIIDFCFKWLGFFNKIFLISDQTPEGSVVSDPGAFCFNTSNNKLYFKQSGTSSTGWNDCSNAQTLNNQSASYYLNAGNINAGVLGSNYGGSGSISGLLKANGSGVVSQAEAGTDYLAPNGNGSSLTGLTKSQVGLGNVENTALSTWAGSSNISTVGTINTGTWSGNTITANKGGTGQSSYVLGNILYANDETTLLKLSPNISTTKQFLSQTGDGNISAAPAWSTLTKSDVGLGNVDNTSDSDKPISTATQTALNNKANKNANDEGIDFTDFATSPDADGQITIGKTQGWVTQNLLSHHEISETGGYTEINVPSSAGNIASLKLWYNGDLTLNDIKIGTPIFADSNISIQLNTIYQAADSGLLIFAGSGGDGGQGGMASLLSCYSDNNASPSTLVARNGSSYVADGSGSDRSMLTVPIVKNNYFKVVYEGGRSWATEVAKFYKLTV